MNSFGSLKTIKFMFVLYFYCF